jgi:uncharacterized repeat protein (TIGR03806 family)
MLRNRLPLVATALSGAALVGLALGCGGGGAGGGGSYGLDRRVVVTTLTFPPTVPTAGTMDAKEAWPSLPDLEYPVGVFSAPGDATHVYVLEQRGRIRVVSTAPGTSSYGTFLDLSAVVTQTLGEEGLVGLAFHPNYASNGVFYVDYVEAGAMPRKSVVARYTRSAGNPLVADTTETRILSQAFPYANHHGGTLAFGPDGYLYVSWGDGGNWGDPQNNALDTSVLLGKILRLDVDGGSPYAIPASNPFASSSGSERKEIFAWGFRNPWRFSFDPTTGNVWCGDVGQDEWEEVDLVVKGASYGWKAFEGNDTFSEPDTSRGPFTPPVIAYGRSKGSCVIGGHVYRGSAIPSLYGAYVYGDYSSGRIWALSWDGTQVVANVEVASADLPASFGLDPAGEILLCERSSGRLKRIVPKGIGGGGTFPATLSATGIYEDLDTLEPSPGLVPYDVNSPLWSDDAIKDRLIALPGVERIAWHEDDAWGFPGGTVLVKTFRLPLVAGDPSSAVKVETRVLISTASGWEGYSYRWRDDQSDADLLAAGDTRTLTIADAAAPGGTRDQTWTFPSRTDCLRCHTSAAGRVLGVRTSQLNGDFDYGAVVDNQIRAWDHVGLFDVHPPAPGSLPAFPRPSDAAAPLAARARALLDSNCSMCHRPGGPSNSPIDLRASIALSAMGIVDVAPQFGDLGLVAPKIVASGTPSNSVLWLRMLALDGNRMPPLASHLVDPAGTALVSDWIESGP